MDDLDRQLAELLVDDPGASRLPVQIQNERIGGLEERVAALESALYSALDAFESLAEKRIEAAAIDAAMAVQRHLSRSTEAVLGGGERAGGGDGCNEPSVGMGASPEPNATNK